MLQRFLIITILSCAILSCSTTKEEPSSEVPEKQYKEITKLDNGKNKGGVLRLNETGNFTSLFPLHLNNSEAIRIAGQMYQGLVKLNEKTLKAEPCLAKKWTISEDGKTYTFILNNNIKFHDNEVFKKGKGRTLNAYDIAFAYKNICTKLYNNKMFWLFENNLKGAKAFYKKTEGKSDIKHLEMEGIKVINDTTLVLELINGNSSFLNVLAHPGCWVYPKELLRLPPNSRRLACIGTGPFKIKSFDLNSFCELVPNEHYWKSDAEGNQLPYLSSVKIFFLDDKKRELNMFKQGKLDLVYNLPLKLLKKAFFELEDAIEGQNIPSEVQVFNSTVTQFYGFNHNDPIFKNKFVRLAFNNAIDRSEISKYVLLGDAKPASYGIIPPIFSDYPYESVEGYNFDPELAKNYLELAGYKNGVGFPEVTLNISSEGKSSGLIAGNIAKMLNEVLGIKVNLKSTPEITLNQEVNSKKLSVWQANWNVKYPDPLNYLKELYSASPTDTTNPYGFNNSQFNLLIEQALKKLNTEQRNMLLTQAEQIAINEGALMPIYYDEITRLMSKRVSDFPEGALEYYDLSEVYLQY